MSMTEEDKRAHVAVTVAQFTSHLASVIGGQALVVAWPEVLEKPVAAGWGNTTGLAGMLRQVCEDTISEPRPTDCAKCAASWDMIKAAHLALTAASGHC